MIDEKFGSLRSELTKESRIRAEGISMINNTLESHLPKLNEAIRATAAEREETDLNILKKCTEELTNIREAVEDERRARENSEAATYDMLKDVVSKIKNEIDGERKER